MTQENLERLKYPVGAFSTPAAISEGDIKKWIGILERFPEKLRLLVSGLTDEQLDTPYRPGGWTVRQTVHHIGDSHMNAYVRFKWTLTEDHPQIKAYYEDRWAELPDSYKADVNESLAFLDLLHRRFVVVLKNMKPEDWSRSFVHPVSGENRLDVYLALYAWHSEHHYAHIENLMKREGWT